MLAKKTDDYGENETNLTDLKIANTHLTRFLVQAELRAINQGLKFGQLAHPIDKNVTYVGYFN